jgi:uncharacterized protein (UPF0261 family)
MARVLLVGTYETKPQELAYMRDALARHGQVVVPVDVSLGSGGRVLSGAEKVDAMARLARAAAALMARECDACRVAVGLGGGTGGEIVAAALKGLPATYPKVLVTTMAFDPRDAVADTAITLVPTLCDIEGLNAPLRQVLENAAAMVAALARVEPVAPSPASTVAVSTLGATGGAGHAVARALGAEGLESTVFHANGYGGAALARFLEEGHAEAVIDIATHELGRIRIAGAHVPMPGRFSSGEGLPRVVLPGALNFLGLGRIDTVSPAHLRRRHYRHTSQFTHVKLTQAEMEGQAHALADLLNRSRAPCTVILPMGGFSHEDRPGGAIEDPRLRALAASILTAEARAYSVRRIRAHVNAPETARAAVDALLPHLSHARRPTHA